MGAFRPAAGWCAPRAQPRNYCDGVIAIWWHVAQSADEFSFNVRMAGLIASYLDERYHGWFYATAQNLRRRLTAAYDEVLEDVDVLALPTAPSGPSSTTPNARTRRCSATPSSRR